MSIRLGENSLSAFLEAPEKDVPALQLLADREPRRRQILGDLGYVLSRKPAVPEPDPSYWDTVFVPTHLPWKTFFESLLYHGLVLALLIAWAQFKPIRHISQVDPWKDTKLVVYPATAALKPDLPKLDTGSSGPHRAQAGDPAFARQPILSVPREPDNRAQTIVTPPDIILRNDVRMPNIVAWSSLPVAPTPALTALASERTVLAPSLTVVAPAPQVEDAHRSSLTLPQIGVVAPPPAVPDATAQNRPSLATAVVPPPPTVDSPVRTLGTMNLGRAEVVAPAPQLPVSEQQALQRAAGRQAGQSLSGAVVPPPPSIASNGTPAPGRMIALSVNPAAPTLPVSAPAGNRRGEFSATPLGRPEGSGRPTIPESSKTNNASTGSAATTSGLPPGIRIGDAATAQPSSLSSASGHGGMESLASITIDRHPIAASIPPPRVNTANRKPAVLSERTPTETERKVFGPKRFYTMMLNMPNLNSAGGSWVVRFAELKAGAAQGELFSPLLTVKSDPAYPSELQRANVQGTVTLYAVIHSDGTVRDIRVLDGADDRLDHYASEALSRCRFEPAIKDGVPVALEAVVAIPFRARKEF